MTHLGLYVKPGIGMTIGQMETLVDPTGQFHFATSMHYGNWTAKFNENDDRANGRIPIESIGCKDQTAPDVTKGIYDTIITARASEMKAFPGTVILRYCWEPNDPLKKLAPADFIAAWNHVRAIYKQVGATNVLMNFSPGAAMSNAGAYWPGSSAVDFNGCDVYDRTQAGFVATIGKCYNAALALDPNMPIIVGETNADVATNQVAYFQEAIAGLSQFPKLVYLNAFDGGQGATFLFSPAGQASFVQFAQATMSLPTPSPAPARPEVPFSPSPFSIRLSGTEPIDPNSPLEIAAMYAVDGAFWMSEIAVPIPGDTLGTSGEMFSVAYATDSDPAFTIHCTLYSNCPEEGQVVHIPGGLMPEDGYTHGGEGHTVIINLTEGREDGFYHLNQVVPTVPGPLDIGYGGPCPFTAYANGGACSEAQTAGNIPMGGMLLRADELIAATAAKGDLGHVLYITTCVSKGNPRWPATSGNGNGNAACPPMGSRIVLRKTDAQIAALNVPEWTRVLYRTIAHYGMMADDNNNNTVWTFGAEDDNGRTSLGFPAVWPDAIALIAQDAAKYNVDLSTAAGSYHIHLPFDTLKQSDMAVLAQ